MKTTQSQLKQIINEELNLVLEDRQAHIAGIQKKLPNLRKELESLEDMCSAATQVHPIGDASVCKQRDQVEWRIETLEAQLEELTGEPIYPGVELPAGKLTRGEGPFETPEKDAKRKEREKEEWRRKQRKHIASFDRGRSLEEIIDEELSQVLKENEGRA